jgi:ATP-dependent RNA helicase DDX42
VTAGLLREYIANRKFERFKLVWSLHVRKNKLNKQGESIMFPIKRKGNPLGESDSEEESAFQRVVRSKPNPSSTAGKPLVSQRFPMGKPKLGASAISLTASNTSTELNKVPASIVKAEADEDDEDPLDAFMQGVDAQAAEEKRVAEKNAQEAISKDLVDPTLEILDGTEDGDGIDAYVRFLESKAASRSTQRVDQPPNQDPDSDEEVYRVAYEMEKQLAELRIYYFICLVEGTYISIT